MPRGDMKKQQAKKVLRNMRGEFSTAELRDTWGSTLGTRWLPDTSATICLLKKMNLTRLPNGNWVEIRNHR
jgi:hypothetical protein